MKNLTGKRVRELIANGNKEVMEILNKIPNSKVLELWRDYDADLIRKMIIDITKDKELTNEIKKVTNKVTKKVTKKVNNKVNNNDNDEIKYDDVAKIQIGKYEIDKYLFEYLKNILNLTHRQTLATLNKVANLKPMKLATIINEFTIDNSIWEDVIMTGIEYLLVEFQTLPYYPINATIEDKERYRIMELKLFYSCMSRAIYTVFKENGIFTQSVYNRKTHRKESRLTRLEVNNENL